MNLQIIIVSLILLLPLSTVSTVGIIDDPYRPIYLFSDEVFKNLPPIPDDFYEIKKLYATQTLQDYDRLTLNYYLQPEFYPWWFDIANETYTRDPRIHGKFGAGFYPSKVNITIQQGLTFDLTTLLYTSPGVETYQGTLIEVSYDKNLIEVQILEPTPTEIESQNPLPHLSFNPEEPSFFLLLKPTYPYFNSDWVKKFKIRITALKPGNTTLTIKNSKPPEEIDNYYIDLYGRENYTSGNTFFGMNLPAFKAKIHVVSSNQSDEFRYKILKPDYTLCILLIILIVVVVGIVVWRRYHGRR